MLRRHTSLMLVILAVVAASLAAPAVAAAGTVEVQFGTLTYKAEPGERNKIIVAVRGSDFVVDDVDRGAVVAAGTGCRSDRRNRARCDIGQIDMILAELGDRNVTGELVDYIWFVDATSGERLYNVFRIARPGLTGVRRSSGH